MRARDLESLGVARVYRSPRDGEIIVDTDTIRRQSTFSGAFAGEPGYGDDDLGDDVGDDDLGDDDLGDDDLGDDDLGDDDLGDDVGDDLGDDDLGDELGGRRRRRRKNRRQGRRARRKERRVERKWGKTLVSGTATLTAAGQDTIPIRLQHDFKAEDITFTGSLPGSKVLAIRFGDRLVWDNAAGADVSVFEVTGFFRGLLKGQELRAGLDISINVTMPGPGSVTASIMGYKPVAAC